MKHILKEREKEREQEHKINGKGKKVEDKIDLYMQLQYILRRHGAYTFTAIHYNLLNNMMTFSSFYQLFS